MHHPYLRLTTAVRLCVAGTLLGAALVGAGPGSSSPTLASSGPVLQATLDGRAIALSEVGRYHCDDLAAPQIHCFASAAARDADVVALQPALAPMTAAYVQWWDNAYPTSSSGSYVASLPYPDLRTIGWNDRISAFVALGGHAGRFGQDIGMTGRLYNFCCNVSVPYVGDAWNDTFSSVEPLS